MSKKIYIAGPITGQPQLNTDEFSYAAERIRQMGHKVVNPHEIFDGIDTSDFKHVDYMRHCISELAHCDEVVTLMGWENSIGANQEVRIARIMSKPVIHITKFLKS